MSLAKITRALSWQSLLCWFDSHASAEQYQQHDRLDQIDWLRAIPFIALHIGVVFVFVVGWSPIAVAIAVLLYALRMFAITAFYHRYFSHRSFRASRAVQFIFALVAATSAQRGPLWWAAHHRLHHAHADKEHDEHSPNHKSFLWSHMGWFLSRRNLHTPMKRVSDFAIYPELRFIDRFDSLMPVLLGAFLYALGEWLAVAQPGLATNGWQLLVWGIISTVVLYHMTFFINSLAHTVGQRRFATGDDSRNNFWLALVTMGEGWHNNHHYYPGSARQGFVWWEIDMTYYLLKLMQSVGLISGLRPVPERVMRKRADKAIY